MDLELYYTFSVEDLQAEMMAGNFSNIRTFEYGYMSKRFEAPNPQWVVTWDNNMAWQKVSETSHLPLGDVGPAFSHSVWARFYATCMYFGAELVLAKRRLGLDSEVPIGLVQSAVGGTIIEAWMPNASRAACQNISSSGDGSLYHAMVAPFANYSVAGWLWYQVGDEGGSAICPL